ncbi:MAG: HEAT repeat domain-containing protein [Bacteroidota bacterium]
MKRILLVLVLICIAASSLVGQADYYDIFEELKYLQKEDSILYDSLRQRQLRGIMASLGDSSLELRSKTLIGLKAPYWKDKLTDSIKSKLFVQLELGSSSLTRTARGVLGNWSTLDSSYLQSIVELFKDEDEDVRRSAVKSLSQQENLPDNYLQFIVELFKDESYDVRRTAVEAFSQKENLSNEVLQSIVELFKNESYDVRRTAVEALNQQENLSNQLLLSIVELFKDESYNVRRTAVEALSQQENLSDMYLQSFVELFKDEDYFMRRTAVEALSQQENLSDKYLQSIVRLFKDENYDVRGFAVLALGRQENLSDKYLQSIVRLFKDENYYVRGSAVLALGQQENLEDKYLQSIVELFKDEDVRGTAVEALGLQEDLEDKYLQSIVKLLKDENYLIRGTAVEALGLQEDLEDEYLQSIVKLLMDESNNVRRSAVLALGKQAKLIQNNIFREKAYLFNDKSIGVCLRVWEVCFKLDSFKWVFPFPFVIEKMQYIAKEVAKGRGNLAVNTYSLKKNLYQVSGWGGDLMYLLPWMGHTEGFKYPVRFEIDSARHSLEILLSYEGHLDTLLNFREEWVEAVPKLIKAGEAKGGWNNGDLEDLRKAERILKKYKATGADLVHALVQKLVWQKWYNRLGLGVLIHICFWLLLIIAYPRSSEIQAIFFWNPWIRIILGLGYVSLLITWIPFLRKRMFAPFKENLVTDAFPAHWNKDEYFPESKVFSVKDKKTLNVFEAISPLKGQALLQGESGLGKTMFLREMALKADRIIAFLPANRCSQGLIPAIQHKLHGAAADEDYLKKLIYAGAIDIYIDGLNEISIDSRTKLVMEVERYFKGNVLLTTQPMEWEPPASSKPYLLQSLEEDDIRQFLLSRYPFLEKVDLLPESSYKEKTSEFLDKVFDKNLDAITLKANRYVLSNPMDLVVVAQLLGRGETPGLLDLHQQQYDLMAADFKAKNQQRDFPLEKFSEAVYTMRIEDESAIPKEVFMEEIQTMERWKMVQLRQTKDAKGQPVSNWFFRHDKIMDFFLVKEFLPKEDLMDKHLADPRFRGVYFLLASKLPYDEAKDLLSMILKYSAETSDHSILDIFSQIMSRRKNSRDGDWEINKEIAIRYLVRGKVEKALDIIDKFAKGEDLRDSQSLRIQYEDLKRDELRGKITYQEGVIRRNQINDSILDLIDRMK